MTETENLNGTAKSAPETATKSKPARKAPSRRSKAVATISRRADDTVKASADALAGSPLSAIAGAVAIGAVAAALIPATKRELAAIGPVGDRIRDAFDEALKAAREAGLGELTASGITLTAATSGLSGVLATLIKAATVSATAAGSAVRQPKTPTAAPAAAD